MNEHPLWDFNKTTDVVKLLQTLIKEKQEKKLTLTMWQMRFEKIESCLSSV